MRSGFSQFLDYRHTVSTIWKQYTYFIDEYYMRLRNKKFSTH